jgi:hypothetical protein
MTAFLAARRTETADLPAYLEELADYEWIRFKAVTSRETGLDRTVFMRRYTHAVPAYAEAADRRPCPLAPGDVPEARPVTVVVFRSPVTLRARAVSPSTAQLFVLARHQGEIGGAADAEWLARSDRPERSLALAADELRAMGILDREQP